MSGPFERGVSGARIIAIVAVVLLAVGVGVLSVWALQRGAGAPGASGASPAPTFTFERGTPTASATPTPTPTTPVAVADASERFLALDGDTLWRATAGACDGEAPVVELSTDGGESWSDATPTGVDAVQVLGVATFGGGDGEVIAAVGSDCEPAALRSYSAGADWDSYADALTAATFLSPSDGTTVVRPDGDVTAPCAAARSVRTSRDAVGLICDGTVFALIDGEWMPVATDAIALDAEAGTLVVAHASANCAEGVAVTRFDGTSGDAMGCISGVDVTAPAAISVLGDDLALWTGDAILTLD